MKTKIEGKKTQTNKQNKLDVQLKTMTCIVLSLVLKTNTKYIKEEVSSLLWMSQLLKVSIKMSKMVQEWLPNLVEFFKIICQTILDFLHV